MSSNDSGASAGAASKEPQWEPSPPDAISEWLAGKSPAEFSALEQDGRALYPEVLQRRSPKSGNLEEVKVMLRVPNTAEQLRSRIDALDQVAKMAGLKARPTMAEAEALLGVSYFDNLDTVHLLSQCILDSEPLADGTHPRYMMADHLDKMHPRSSLHAVYERLNFYQAIEDPRVADLDEEKFGQAVAAIAKVRNLSPLVVIDGRAHASFFVSMAERLAPYLTH